MSFVVKSGGGTFEPAPEGMCAAVCIDVVDLGMREKRYGKDEPKLVHELRVVWSLEHMMKNGKPYTISRWYTASLHKKANLRKDLETWRGKRFSESELAAKGFDMEKLVGAGANLVIQHDVKEDGTIKANVVSVLPLKGKAPDPDPSYIRVKHREGNGTKPLPSQKHTDWGSGSRNEPPPHEDHDDPGQDDDEAGLGGVFD